MKTHILYIPGLGDGYDGFRIGSLRLWKPWGVNALHIPITWYDGGSMESKMTYIQRAIDSVPEADRIVLIGESAGASLALHAAESNKHIARVITLCGVARPDTPVSSYLRQRAPALHQAVQTLPETFDAEVVSVRSAIDWVVGKRYSIVKNAQVHVIWSVGHITTIALCLTVLSPYMVRLAKKGQ